MTDFRALCEELLRSLENYPVQPLRDRDLCIRARAALAEQPVSQPYKLPEIDAKGPTDEEIIEMMPQQMCDLNRHAVAHARAVLARRGQP